MLKRDFTQNAKSIIDKVTGNVPPEEFDTRNPHTVALSKFGASKGGKIRAKNLTAKNVRKSLEKQQRSVGPARNHHYIK